MVINDNHSDYTEKMQRCQEYIGALEEERRKIQVFERELPLCLELVTQAIETCRQQLCEATPECFHGQSECSEQISSEGPVLEEFIPIKRTSSSDDDEHQSHKHKNNSSGNNRNKGSKNNDKSSKKSDWLRSAQLWNETPDPPIKEYSPKKVSVMEVKRDGGSGAFHPFKREKSVGTAQASVGRSPSAVAASSSTTETGGSSGNKREEKEGQSQRKARRCWSPELHRRFLQSLQQLGGSHVATPKQIRELMRVDGLTNDEVKSHLQKYRLHTRRPSHGIHNNNNNQQAPQFVVVGGIWMPPPEYAAVATTTASGEASGVATPKGIYAPVATPPPPPPFTEASVPLNQRQQHKQLDSDERRSHSNSPATSSSTHTTTASPAF